jgi:uncharacterized OsmC-like protein
MQKTKELQYAVSARRADAHGSIAKCKSAEIVLDTDLAGRPDAFNPAELLLAALAACMSKGIERVAPLLRFEYGGVEVSLRGTRQDAPPRMSRIEYDITIETQEADHRLALLHENVRKFGTVFNTVAPGTELTGVLRRSTRSNTYVAAEQAPLRQG